MRGTSADRYAGSKPANVWDQRRPMCRTRADRCVEPEPANVSNQSQPLHRTRRKQFIFPVYFVKSRIILICFLRFRPYNGSIKRNGGTKTMRLHDVQDTRKTTVAEESVEIRYSLFTACQRLASVFGVIIPVDNF